MSNPVKTPKADRHVDAWATLFMIVLVVAAIVFWTTHS